MEKYSSISESDADGAKQLSNEPRYYHYIPQFYLGRWANSERKICRFSKPHDRIVPKMVGVKGTGGQDDSQLEFVREHMFTKPEKPLFQQMIEFRQQAGSYPPPNNIR